MKRELLVGQVFAYFTVLILLLMPARVPASSLPEKGTVLPAIQLPAPSIEEDRKYLGIPGETFELREVGYQVLLLEIIGVYCPRCYEQVPLFNKLFDRIEKRKLNDRVKMLGVAAGGTLTEVKHLREKGEYKYPVVQDESFTAHKLLGEPRTPFTLLVDKEGKVLYSHLGTVENIDELYEMIKSLVK